MAEATETLPPPCDLPSAETERPKEGKYEYLDHTADVQIHAWGDTLPEAFEQAAVAMFGYMTDIETVSPLSTEIVTAEDPFFIPRIVKITDYDPINFKLTSEGYGETFDLKKHPQGTEVKAITYSNMQIFDEANRHEVYVIIDI